MRIVLRLPLVPDRRARTGPALPRSPALGPVSPATHPALPGPAMCSRHTPSTAAIGGGISDLTNGLSSRFNRSRCYAALGCSDVVHATWVERAAVVKYRRSVGRQRRRILRREAQHDR